ncbi:isoleucine--tRNA ligase [Huso huso]|uniref:Isoleucine--tRNA ligase n=1 Tax=Huso huso TaxID=61971 RepID=A0ABR0ZWF0_HUSHU
MRINPALAHILSLPYGADTLRWWDAGSNVFSEVTIGPSVHNAAHESSNKLRNTLRFMVGKLHGFEPQKHSVSSQEMFVNDQYMLHLLQEFSIKVFFFLSLSDIIMARIRNNP